VTSHAVRERQSGIGGLWGQRGFLLLWSGETVSQFGNAVALVALPLVAIDTLKAGAFAVALLNAVAWLPWVVVGLLAGAWTDRLKKRPLMLACDVAAALLFSGVPLAVAAHVLTIWLLLAAAFLAGVANVFFTTAYQAYVPVVAGPADLTEANAKLQASKSTAQVGGPGLGGAIAQLLGAAAGLLLDAASFLVSAVCLLLIREREPARENVQKKTRLHQEIAEGIRFLAADPFLRPLTMYAALVNIPIGGIDALLLLFLVRTVGVSAGAAGAIMALVGAGCLVGALFARRVARVAGTARAVLLWTTLTAPFGLLIPLATKGPGVLFISGYAVSNAGIIAFNVLNAAFRQRYCPPGMLGRVAATTYTFCLGCIPIGALLAGALATAYGTRLALWIMAVALAATGALLLFSALRSVRDFPVHPE
jgi:predicted MFS family arabinose efflux permease